MIISSETLRKMFEIQCLISNENFSFNLVWTCFFADVNLYFDALILRYHLTFKSAKMEKKAQENEQKLTGNDSTTTQYCLSI